jgi:peptidoglycan/LPS O-acetylase OafA/YrhL
LAYWLASTGFAARSPLLFFAVYTALAIAASCAVYRWIEEPLNRALRRRLG